jgi:subtilisin family serine protease
MQLGSRLTTLVLAFTLLPTAVFAGAAGAQNNFPAPRYVPGEVLVGLDDSAGAPLPDLAVQSVGRIAALYPELGVARVVLNRGLSIAQGIAALRGRPGIRYAEPNFVRHAYATPNDTNYASKQWGPQKVKMPQVWDIWQPKAQKVVAIIDTGCDLDHPDLVNVYLKDVGGAIVGRNVINTGIPPEDDHGHGTHCAGTAAAQINNGLGVAGIAGWNPNVAGSDGFIKVMPIKVLDSSGSGDDAGVAAGIRWAVDHGAHVISMSLGGPDFSTTLQDACAYALNNNVVVVAAAGNDGSSSFSYPGAYSTVISVAATQNDAGDTLASFSNYGSWVKTAAPGVSIYSTAKGGGYIYMAGTSMATPHVAGEAVLLRAAAPSLNATQICNLIVNNTDPYTPYSGRTLAAGAGRINVYKALLAAVAGSGGLISVSLAPNPVTGGLSSTGSVTLGANAPAGGKVVTLSSNNVSVVVPGTVTVPAGSSSTTFTATTQPVASNLSATITAAVPENSLDALLTVIPPVVSALTLTPSSLAGGNTSVGKVTLNAAAPAGGKVVTLTSNKPDAVVPATVTVPEGATTAQFNITTTPVTANTSVTITAKTGTTTKTATLTVKLAGPKTVTFSPTSVMSGNASTGTVTLTGPAPAAGITVTLASNKPEVTVPNSVFVNGGSISAQFTANTGNVTANLAVSVTATANSIVKSGALTVLPVLKSVTVSPSSVIGGKSATGTVTLNGAAPAGGVVVTISDTNAAADTVASVTVLAGATTATFPITTTPVSSNTTGTFSGTALGATKTSSSFTVKPPALSGFSFTPSSILSGVTSTGKLTISGAAPAGFTVNLTSGNGSVAPVPVSVTFATGQTTATFTVTGGSVSSSTPVQITAKDPALVTKIATLTVNP